MDGLLSGRVVNLAYHLISGSGVPSTSTSNVRLAFSSTLTSGGRDLQNLGLAENNH